MSLSVTSVNLSVSKQCWACCKEPSEINRCGKCRTAIYCNQTCQRAHWPVHKNVCCKQIPESKDDAVIQIARSASVVPISTRDEMQKLLVAEEVEWTAYQKNSHTGMNENFWLRFANEEIEQDIRPSVCEDFFGIESVGGEENSLKPGDHVIDLGAGCGSSAEFFLVKKQCDVTAIDNFPGFANFLEPLKSRFNKRLTVVEKDLTNGVLPKDGKISLISALRVLGYCPPSKIIVFLEDAYKSLKPRGQLHISFFDTEVIKRCILKSGKSPQNRILECYKAGAWMLPNRKVMERLLHEMGFLIMGNGVMPDNQIVFTCLKK